MSRYTRRFGPVPRPNPRAHPKSLRGGGNVPLVHDVLNPDNTVPPSSSISGVELPLWIQPPIQWENIDQIGYVTIGAVNASVTIISFQVPIGRNGIINKVANNFVGGGWTEGTGDVLWRILVDGAPPPGANSYDAIPASLGSPANPVKISGFRIFENQVVQLVAFNNGAGPNGGIVPAGQLVGGRLVGYLYPRELEDENIWI
jgi:hypothetical protein